MQLLAGVNVLEFEGLGPGPLAGWMLTRMGARVTLVRRPGGAEMARVLGDSADNVTQGKQIVTLDLKSCEGVASALQLCATSAALIEGSRPGVMERLGLGPKDCARVNPALVYGRMTGWGQSGPLAHTAGHDLNYVALSGLLSLASRDGARPILPPTVLGDATGALGLALGIVSGLLQARVTGQGVVVDAAILDVLAMVSPLVQKARARGDIDAGRPSIFHDSPFYEVYECADRRWLSVCPIEPRFYREFLLRLGCEDVDPSRQFDRDTWPTTQARIAQVFKTRTRDAWEHLFEGSDACVTAVLTIDEAARHSHNLARGLFRRDQRGAIFSVRALRTGPLAEGWSE